MMMAIITMNRLLLLALLLVAGRGVQAFQPSLGSRRPLSSARWAPLPRTTLTLTHKKRDEVPLSQLSHRDDSSRVVLSAFKSAASQDDNSSNIHKMRFSLRRYIGRVVRRVPTFFRPILRVCAMLSLVLVSCFAVVQTQPVQASAPVMAIPKEEQQDPITEAMTEHKRSQVTAQQQELIAFSKKCRDIEAKQGAAARVKYEKEYQQKKIEQAAEREKGLEQLKRNLLDEGIDPFCDLEGQRQVTFYTEGIDLGEVAGTPFYLENLYQTKNFKKSQAFLLQNHRKLIALMVKDMRNRGVDPLQYFQGHQDNTIAILELPAPKAAALVEKYEANLEQYGQILPPKEGELSMKEKIAKDPKAAKTQQKAAEKLNREKAKAAKAAAKLEQDKEKAAAKLEQQRQRASDKAKAAAGPSSKVSPDSMKISEEASAAEDAEAIKTTHSIAKSAEKRKLSIVPVASVLVAVGGGGYAFKLYKDKAGSDEAERQRQFRMLMGDAANFDKSKSSSAIDEDNLDLNGLDDDDDGFFNDTTPSKIVEARSPSPTPAPVQTPTEAAPKKRGGLKGIFNRNKNKRETDINVLVSPDAESPEFAKLLAKLLVFGAPGRFSKVDSLPGSSPMQTFDLESAKQMLRDAREQADLDLVSSAEIFANVVSCMLIDITDLASAALQEKDTKNLIDAMDAVLDFVEHAASLYDSVAEGVVIAPVTYEGNLRKGKLENMFSAYAEASILNPRDDADARMSSLTDIFKLNQNKATGLMMKALQKKFAEQAKSGNMEEMLGSMGGIPMGDMAKMVENLNSEDFDPSQVKKLLLGVKQIKDAGEISDEELSAVKDVFEKSYGMSVDDVIREQAANDSERELLELIKSIFE
jgi:hypothetical protein